MLERQRHWDADASAYRSALELVKGEIAIMQELKHPHVVQLHDVVDTAESLHLVIDYVPGGPLMGSPTDSRLRYWTPLSEPRLCAAARHRVRTPVPARPRSHPPGHKPDNILLDADGRACPDFMRASCALVLTSRLDGSDSARRACMCSRPRSSPGARRHPGVPCTETYQQGRRVDELLTCGALWAALRHAASTSPSITNPTSPSSPLISP